MEAASCPLHWSTDIGHLFVLIWGPHLLTLHPRPHRLLAAPAALHLLCTVRPVFSCSLSWETQLSLYLVNSCLSMGPQCQQFFPRERLFDAFLLPHEDQIPRCMFSNLLDIFMSLLECDQTIHLKLMVYLYFQLHGSSMRAGVMCFFQHPC